MEEKGVRRGAGRTRQSVSPVHQSWRDWRGSWDWVSEFEARASFLPVFSASVPKNIIFCKKKGGKWPPPVLKSVTYPVKPIRHFGLGGKVFQQLLLDFSSCILAVSFFPALGRDTRGSSPANLARLSSSEKAGLGSRARVPHQVNSCRIRRGSGRPSLSMCL